MTEIKWDAESAEKGGYEHFMLKEIHEQPKAVQDTLGAYIKDSAIDFSEAGLTDEQLKALRGSMLRHADRRIMSELSENM